MSARFAGIDDYQCSHVTHAGRMCGPPALGVMGDIVPDKTSTATCPSGFSADGTACNGGHHGVKHLHDSCSLPVNRISGYFFSVPMATRAARGTLTAANSVQGSYTALLGETISVQCQPGFNGGGAASCVVGSSPMTVA